VAAWPSALRPSGACCATGVAGIDEPLGGGLPAGRLTELVSEVAGSGGQTVFAELLMTTRAAGQRIALVDGSNGFAPEAVPKDALRHLVWARAGSLQETLAAADILVRDGNYAAIVLDLRGLSERELRRSPGTLWHRLHRAAERRPAAVLVQSAFATVPAVLWRIALKEPPGLKARRLTRAVILQNLSMEIERRPARLEAEASA